MIGEIIMEDEAMASIEDWISELRNEEDGIGGNYRMVETRNNSSSSSANSMTDKAWNMRETLHQNAASMSICVPGASAMSKPVVSHSGLTENNTMIKAVGNSTSFQNLPQRSTSSNNQVRLDMQPISTGNLSEESSRYWTSKSVVFQPLQQQQSIGTAWSQSYHDSKSAKQLGNLCTASLLQHRQQHGLQSFVSDKQQQLPKFQYDVLNSLQRPQEVQNSLFSSLNTQPQQQQEQQRQQQQQQIIRVPSNSLKLQEHQHPFDVSRHSGAMSSKQNFQKMSQSRQFAWNFGTPAKLQSSAFAHSEGSTAGDLKRQMEQSNRVLPENASGSTTLVAQTNSSDWYDRAYQQLLRMKEAYLPDMIKMHKRLQELSLQPINADATKNETYRIFIEKIMRFLQMPKANFVHLGKDKVCHQMKILAGYLNNVRNKHTSSQHNQQLQQPGGQLNSSQLQQRGEGNSQGNNPRQQLTSILVGAPLSLTPVGPLSSQARPMNSIQKGPLRGIETADGSSINLPQYGLGRPAELHMQNRPQEVNMRIPHFVGSQSKFEQKASGSLTNMSGTNVVQKTLNGPVQLNFSVRDMVNTLDSTMSSLPPNSTPSLSLLVKQQETYQMMQAQKMKQSMQQEVACGNELKMLVQKASEVNDSKLGQTWGHQRMPRQHHFIGQHIDHSPCRRVSLSTAQNHVASPQASHYSSPLVDFEDFSSKSASTPSQSTASPNTASLATLTPSSMVVDSDKSSSSCPLSLTESTKNLDEHLSQLHCHFPARERNQFSDVESYALPRSSLDTETTQKEIIQPSQLEGQGFNQLVEVVKSMSSEALRASAWDIGMIISLTDRISRIYSYDESREYVGDDLACGMRSNAEETSRYVCGTPSEKPMKRYISTMALESPTSISCLNDDFQWQNGLASGMEFSPTSAIKRRKTKPSDVLLQEIEEINQKLIETVVDVILDSRIARNGTEEGIIVRFSYRAVGFGESANSQHDILSKLPNLLLQVLVTAEYPYSSPLIRDELPDRYSEIEEMKALWEKTLSKFISSLRKCSQPISLWEMAITWDVSAREAFNEFAEKRGGGCFSSKYGMWENYIGA